MRDLFTLIFQGGWIMIPLGICSLVGLTIVIERMLALRRHRVIDEGVQRMVEGYRPGSDAEQALIACQRAPGEFARIIEEVLKVRHLDHAQAIESMHAVGRTQVGKLERGLTTLEIVAGASPLMGLLGTVLGMVTVFDAITAQGLGNPQVLSDGISKALVTTVAGLVVAIPAVAFHSYFTKRVEELAVEMQDRATSFIVKLQGTHRDAGI
jgi:biopolymer transport protein ExbB